MGFDMRISTRLFGVAAAVAAAMALGSPAFAGESSDGGDGGESANTLSCLVNVPILSPNSDQECNPSADGGK